LVRDHKGVEFLRKKLHVMASDFVPDASEETIKAIFALMNVYMTRMSKPAGPHLWGLYPAAMFLQQDCMPNTISCFEAFPKTVNGNFRGRIKVRAIRDIPK